MILDSRRVLLARLSPKCSGTNVEPLASTSRTQLLNLSNYFADVVQKSLSLRQSVIRWSRMLEKDESFEHLIGMLDLQACKLQNSIMCTRIGICREKALF